MPLIASVCDDAGFATTAAQVEHVSELESSPTMKLVGGGPVGRVSLEYIEALDICLLDLASNTGGYRGTTSSVEIGYLFKRGEGVVRRESPTGVRQVLLCRPATSTHVPDPVVLAFADGCLVEEAVKDLGWSVLSERITLDHLRARTLRKLERIQAMKEAGKELVGLLSGRVPPEVLGVVVPGLEDPMPLNVIPAFTTIFKECRVQLSDHERELLKTMQRAFSDGGPRL